MKYQEKTVVSAVYDTNSAGRHILNPFLEAMPELMDKETFFGRIASLPVLQSIYYPMDYMYNILQNELDAATKYAREQEAEKRSIVLHKGVEIQQELVEQLSPKGGVRQKVLEYHIRPLQNYCNGKMGNLLPGYDMVLDTSNGFQVLFADKTGGGMINYKSLSKGEQLRAAYVLMSMFNVLNQFRPRDNVISLTVAAGRGGTEMVDYPNVVFYGDVAEIIDNTIEVIPGNYPRVCIEGMVQTTRRNVNGQVQYYQNIVGHELRKAPTNLGGWQESRTSAPARWRAVTRCAASGKWSTCIGFPPVAGPRLGLS